MLHPFHLVIFYKASQILGKQWKGTHPNPGSALTHHGKQTANSLGFRVLPKQCCVCSTNAEVHDGNTDVSVIVVGARESAVSLFP